jgi:hypothetical protein
MKKVLMILIMACGMGILVGCSSMGGCGDCGSCGTCGYYDYSSQCGGYSCTDNYQIIQYSNPCPGPYRCNMQMDWV